MINIENIFLENIFSKEECVKLESLVFNLKSQKNILDFSMKNRIGFINAHKMVSNYKNKKISSLIESLYPEKIKFSHAFLAMYRNQAILPIHTDKLGIDITLSINIGGLENWPLNISNVLSTDRFYNKKEFDDVEKFTKNYTSYVTPKGSGVVCYSGLTPHWRDKLICKDDEYVMQIFYHWKFI